MWWPPNIASYANSVVIWTVPGIYHNDSILPFFRFIIIVAADNEMVFPFRWLTLWKGFSLQVEYINMYVADGWCLTFIRLDRIVSQLVLPQSHVPHVNNRANNRQWQLEPQPKSSVTRFTWSDPGLRMIWRKSFQSPRSCSAIRLIAQQYSIYSNSPVGSFTFLHSTWHQRTRVLKSIWMKKLRIFHAFQIPFYCFKIENDLLMTMWHIILHHWGDPLINRIPFLFDRRKQSLYFPCKLIGMEQRAIVFKSSKSPSIVLSNITLIFTRHEGGGRHTIEFILRIIIIGIVGPWFGSRALASNNFGNWLRVMFVVYSTMREDHLGSGQQLLLYPFDKWVKNA